MLIKQVEDSVCIYVLDAGSVRRTITYGSEKHWEEWAIIF
ncbi:CRISPR-associated endonuclease Cas2 [Microcoleus sp. herbarium8]